MINIAIVEANRNEAEKICEYLRYYAENNGEQFSYTLYANANEFLKKAGCAFDMVFLCDTYPETDGFYAAKRIRRTNSQTVIIFISDTARFAAGGYEVDALDYIVKPVTYERFTLKLGKALQMVNSEKGKKRIIRDKSGWVRVSANDIYYVEISMHKLTYHTKSGDFTEIGSLKTVREELSSKSFVCVNSCYLVNMDYVFKVKGFVITMVNGDELKISQPRRKEFMAAISGYSG